MYMPMLVMLQDKYYCVVYNLIRQSKAKSPRMCMAAVTLQYVNVYNVRSEIYPCTLR